MAKRFSPPASLCEDAHGAWGEVVEAVVASGREPTARDLFAMEALAACMFRARQARAVLDREGVVSVDGGAHPAVAVEKAALAEARQIRASLGLFAGTAGAKGIRTHRPAGRPVGAASAPDRAAAREGEPPRLTVVRP